MPAHIFVDNSNIFAGARRAAERFEPNVVSRAVRVHYRNLFRLVESRHNNIASRVMAGSVPPGNEDLWRYAQEAGYSTDLLTKIENDEGRLGEQAVDEILHLKIANALLDFSGYQTLVLVTGDGRETPVKTSFPQQVRRALKKQWYVEVWSWKRQLSGVFRRIADDAGHDMTIHELDRWYKQITFVQAGDYDIRGQAVCVSGRVVQRLVGEAPYLVDARAHAATIDEHRT